MKFLSTRHFNQQVSSIPGAIHGANNDVSLTVDGKTERFMSAFSWFGKNQVVPADFKFAILGKDKFDPLLVFESYLLDANQNKYVKCN